MTTVAAPELPLTAGARRLGDVVVLTLSGTLDPRAPVPSGWSVEAVMTSVDSALARGARLLVADLRRVDLSHFVVGLLGLVRRRAARTGVPFVLAAVPPGGQEQLDRVRVAPLYATYPTVDSAVRDFLTSR